MVQLDLWFVQMRFSVSFSSVEESIHNAFPWCIYFDQDQGIWNGTEWIRREGSYVGSGLTAHEVNGYIHKFCHTQDDRFTEITPDAPLVLNLEGSSGQTAHHKTHAVGQQILLPCAAGNVLHP